MGSGSIVQSFPCSLSQLPPPVNLGELYISTYFKEDKVRKVLKGLPGKRHFSNYWLGPLLLALESLLAIAALPVFPMPHLSLVFCFVSDSGGQDDIETVIPSNQLTSASSFSETEIQFSRYFTEFEELQLLGKGAFGAVIKV